MESPTSGNWISRKKEAELQTPLQKRIAHAIKEHDESDDNKKPQAASQKTQRTDQALWKTHFTSAKQTAWGKQRKKYCVYHGLCYHETSKCNLAKS
eukprot:10920104-Ditylum_brightwellii.AAC.1